jgi:hypothetical protein
VLLLLVGKVVVGPHQDGKLLLLLLWALVAVLLLLLLLLERGRHIGGLHAAAMRHWCAYHQHQYSCRRTTGSKMAGSGC